MSSSTFLCNEALWEKLTAQIKASNRVDAAIAYFGTGGAMRLRLRKGHRLVVDMSPPTVQAGGTNPHEIEKLISDGVRVFSRRNLHAKVVVTNKAVIAGSANVTRNSQDKLEEAAILTTDRSAVRRAREFIDRLCTEPVRPEYLKLCKGLYQPPRANTFPTKRDDRLRRTTHAKLWVVNLHEHYVPESEQEAYGKIEEKARERLRNTTRSKTDSFHWQSRPRLADELTEGDWIIQVTTYKDGSILVSAPGQLLAFDSYPRSGAKGERWVFCLEAPRAGQEMSWSTFRRKTGSLLSASKLLKPRTKAVRDVQAADGLLALWTPAGRISRR